MKKIVLIGLTLLSSLLSEIVNGIAITVDGVPITLFQIEQTEKSLNISREDAVKILIQSSLEKAEAEKWAITVSDLDRDRAVDRIVMQNRLPSRDSLWQSLKRQGVDKEDFLQEIDRQIKVPKLHQRITASKIVQPTERELKEYYKINRNSYRVAKSYDLIIYQSYSREALLQKMENPLLFIDSVQMKPIHTERLTPQLQTLLGDVEVGDFSKVVQQGGAFVTIYLSAKGDEVELSFDEVKGEIAQKILTKQQKRILESHFRTLKQKADIRYIR